MSAQLAVALKELALEPGERRIVTVDGVRFEIRRVDVAIVDEGPMISLDFSPPPADRTFLVKVVPTPLEYPQPFEIF